MRIFYGVSESENPLSGANTPQEISENFYFVKSIRVLRGGSWIVNSAGVRSSVRFTLPPESVHETVGFRCVLDLDVYRIGVFMDFILIVSLACFH